MTEPCAPPQPDACRISFAPAVDRDAAIAQAAVALRRDGVVVLDDLLDPATIAACHAQIAHDDPDYARPDPVRNFGLYPGRFTVPLHVRGSLAERAIFCPPAVAGILRQTLGAAFVIDSFGLLVSLPGAEDQQRHFDALLFPETPLDRVLPPVTIALSVPLVRMDEVSGTTGFWSRSHLDPKRGEGEQDMAPIVPVGSALLWDFRVHHRGLANRSATPRPAVFTVFCRDWWAEVAPLGARFEKLTIARSVHDTFGERLRRITRRARIVD